MKLRLLVLTLWLVAGFFFLASALTLAGLSTNQGSVSLLLLDLVVAIAFSVLGWLVDKKMIRKS